MYSKHDPMDSHSCYRNMSCVCGYLLWFCSIKRIGVNFKAQTRRSILMTSILPCGQYQVADLCAFINITSRYWPFKLGMGTTAKGQIIH